MQKVSADRAFLERAIRPGAGPRAGRPRHQQRRSAGRDHRHCDADRYRDLPTHLHVESSLITPLNSTPACLRNRGLIAPGCRADIVLVEDLAACAVRDVVTAGRHVGPDLFAARRMVAPVDLNSVKAER